MSTGSGALTPVRVVTRQLAVRNLVKIPRVPSTFIPSFVFPVIIVVIFSGVFSAVADLPGFPASSMLDWMLPMGLVQGAAFAGVTSGLGMASDIESGFFDRLLLAPVRPVALVAGSLLASLARALIPFAVVLLIGLAAGSRLRGGVLGILTLLVAAEGVAVVSAAWSVGLALRLRTVARSAPLMQVGVFVTFFLSTAQVPLSVMTGWLHAAARFNPMTNVLTLARQGFLGPVTWGQTWPGLLALAGGVLLVSAFALRGLRSACP